MMTNEIVLHRELRVSGARILRTRFIQQMRPAHDPAAGFEAGHILRGSRFQFPVPCPLFSSAPGLARSKPAGRAQPGFFLGETTYSSRTFAVKSARRPSVTRRRRERSRA